MDSELTRRRNSATLGAVDRRGEAADLQPELLRNERPVDAIQQTWLSTSWLAASEVNSKIFRKLSELYIVYIEYNYNTYYLSEIGRCRIIARARSLRHIRSVCIFMPMTTREIFPSVYRRFRIIL